MYPSNPHYEPLFISDAQDDLEILQDSIPKRQDDISKKFCPRVLKLSNSLPSLVSARRNSCSASVQAWKEGLGKSRSYSYLNSRTDQRHSKLADKLDHPTRTSLQRLRTRSLERKPKERLNVTSTSASSKVKQHDETSNCNGLAKVSPLSSQDAERHVVGFHTHIPIEHTALSVLPSNRKPSIDWTQNGHVTPISRPTIDSDQSSSSATYSASPQSSLATSVNSNGTSPRPRYQPRPLLLSTFGSSKLNYAPSDHSNLMSRNKIYPSADKYSNKPMDQEIINSRLLSLEKLEQAQQIRQEKLHAHEAKRWRRRARETELMAISSSAKNGNEIRSIPEADEDECWCWLSCSDAEDESQNEEAEEMAVVWRASLDIGRRVSRDRKALGRGHGIRLPPKSSHISSTPCANVANSALPHTRWSVLRLQSLMPRHLIKSLWHSPRSFLSPFKTSSSVPFVFGSGLISGLVFSVLSSALFWRLPSLLQRRLVPISTNGIGFFFHLIFPQANSHLYSSPLHFLHSSSIGTSLGLYTQW